MIFGHLKGISFVVITSNLKFNSTCWMKKLPIPLKYFDVTRTTHTNLDVLQESRIDGCWNVDVDWSLSDSWTGFTKFTLLNEKPPKGVMWPRRRLTKNSSNYQTSLFVARKKSPACQKQLRKKKSSNGLSRNRSSTMLGNWEHLLFDPGWWRVQGNHQKRKEKVWRY